MMTSYVSLSDEAIDEHTQVVRAQGELDLYAAPEFKRRLADTIEAGKTRVVVDLTEAAFMDSTALGVLIGALKRLRTRDGVMTIVNRDANIAKTFEITGLDQIFTIVPTREEAVNAVDPARDTAG
jgi:anti-sigma B factor antagonist